MRNSAFLRIGLFGGAFGVDLANVARVDGELLWMRVQMIFIEFAFKFTKSYASPINPELLEKAGDFVAATSTANQALSGQASTLRTVKSVLKSVCDLNSTSGPLISGILQADIP